MAIDWLKAKADYLKTEMTLEEVAVKYDVHPSHLREIAARDKWRETKEQVRQEADKKLIEKLPETMASVKARHAKLGRALQGAAAKALKNGMEPESFNEVYLAARVGVQLEREALGFNDKQMQDEIYQNFSQFTFIFALKDDELRRFAESAIRGTTLEDRSVSPAVIEGESQEAAGRDLGAA